MKLITRQFWCFVFQESYASGIFRTVKKKKNLNFDSRKADVVGHNCISRPCLFVWHSRTVFKTLSRNKNKQTQFLKQIISKLLQTCCISLFQKELWVPDLELILTLFSNEKITVHYIQLAQACSANMPLITYKLHIQLHFL